MSKKVVIIIITIVVISAVLIGLNFVRKNTSFLTTTVDPVVINDNNSNQVPGDNEELSQWQNLQSKKLVVPAQYVDMVPKDKSLNVPPNMTISVYAAGLGEARFMAVVDEEKVFVTDKRGRVLLLRDQDKDGVVDKIDVVVESLQRPHGLAWDNGDLYIAEEHRIIVFEGDADGDFENPRTVIPDLPNDGGHFTRTVEIGPDENLYISVGSSCNVCEEKDDRRATILKYSKQGKFLGYVGRGLRNTVGFTFYDDSLVGVDNGRDWLGDDTPPDEVNILSLESHGLE
ncbi:MAG: hypothetical protein NUV82_00175, partial [Candidatus Komeilibacteria bacterium]|nr:hypothetical protein [Candidatus Komeilibacteria bacterium]